MNETRAINILMVDDNRGDARLTVEALKEANVPHSFHWVSDGDEAIAYLRREPGHESAARPDLILLDLNLPRTDGREVLSVVKADDALQDIPVIILTTSQAENDISNAYQLNANCYIKKPVTMDQYVEVMEAIRKFWIGIAKLPTGTTPSTRNE